MGIFCINFAEQCYSATWDFAGRLISGRQDQGLAFGNGAKSIPDVARASARFRLSLKDQKSGESLKVELIEVPNESPFVSNPLAGRYRVRVNGKAATKVQEIT